MEKFFTVTGTCHPDLNYMVDTTNRIEYIVREYIEKNKYFTINRARQYGKTTTLSRLKERLKNEYYVIRISFEARRRYFQSEYHFVSGFINLVSQQLLQTSLPHALIEKWQEPISEFMPIDDLDSRITRLCKDSLRPIVLMIDEVDKNSDNQIFLDFLALLRDKYLRRIDNEDYTFNSVILASVYDIKNMKLKMRPETEHRYNSPWNIATDFNLDMSFNAEEIAAMLQEYTKDHQLNIDTDWFGHQIHEYTGGYPYLVSRICQFIDENVWCEPEFGSKELAWTPKGFQRAIKMLLTTQSTLFDDMIKKLDEFPKLKSLIADILLQGIEVPNNPDNRMIQIGFTFGLFTECEGKVVVANRIFETRIYNWLISENMENSPLFKSSDAEKYSFIQDGVLNMDLILERFKVHYDTFYCKRDSQFLEREGRFMFLTFLKPIINGIGNYYIEAETRNQRRTDIIVDYLGKQYVIEMKLWHGNEYQNEGIKQLSDYMDSYQLQKGWLISFCFNKSKDKIAGLHYHTIKDKSIVEVII